MAYIGSSPTKVVSRQSANIFTYTAQANQTVFSGADDNGNTLACSPSDIMVHINGLRMEKSDFSATSTSVTLVSGAAVGDEVTITAFLTFESADHYTKSAADTRYVNASGDTMSGDLVVSKTTTPTIQIKDGQASGTRVSGKLHIGEAATLGVTIENSTTSYNDNCAMVFKTSPAAGTLTERMRIDGPGRVTMPSQAYGEAEGNDGGLLASFSSGSIINWLTANHLNGGMSFSNSGRFTVPVAGRYLVSALIYYYPSGSHTAYYSLEIKKNGSLEAFKIDDHVETVSGSIDRTVSINTIVRCSANDYLELGWSSNINASFWRGADHNKFRVLLLN